MTTIKISKAVESQRITEKTMKELDIALNLSNGVSNISITPDQAATIYDLLESYNRILSNALDMEIEV